MSERPRDPVRRFRAFAEIEARGVSPLYEDWALGVAGDPELTRRLAPLPYDKQQAQLWFAAARTLGAPIAPFPEFRAWLLAHWDQVLGRVLERSTQTNEAARCGTLLPALASIPGPLALLEVGASAGLCLLPDGYSYRFLGADGGDELHPMAGPSPVLIETELRGAPAPAAVPEVVWRAGIDLRPVDLADPDEFAWLDALIWPEHEARRARLRAAADILLTDPPRIVPGDLVERVGEVAASAPPDATLVVFHTAVLNYLEPQDRERAVAAIRATGAVWLSNEGPAVLPDITARIVDPPPIGNRLVLAIDGRPIALTAPHGGSYTAVASR